MGGKRISFTLTEDILKELAVKAKENGFISAPAYVRHLTALKPKQNGKHTLNIEVANYDELNEFAASKGFGTIESFATFAMSQYMTKYPISGRKKAETGN